MQFNAFLDLQELTGASDQQLADMLSAGCANLPIANFEDAVTEVVMRLFRNVSGIPWLRGWQQGARPDSQYGTIWLRQIFPESGLVRIENTVEGQSDFCELIARRYRYEFQLDVYGDQGQTVRSSQSESSRSPQSSAIDVLLRLELALQHTRMQQALQQYCLAFEGAPITGIANLPMPMVQGTFENRATGTLTLYAKPVSALRVPTFSNAEFLYECPEF